MDDVQYFHVADLYVSRCAHRDGLAGDAEKLVRVRLLLLMLA